MKAAYADHFPHDVTGRTPSGISMIFRPSATSRALDDTDIDAIEVGHGDGLNGSSLNIGLSRHTNLDYFREAAKVVRRAKIGAILIPGIGTIEDMRRAADAGVSIIRVAIHCTEADLSAQHIAAARKLGIHTSGFLIMSSARSPEDIGRQAKRMENYGAQCIYVADSAGSMTMGEVRARFLAMDAVLDAKTERGIHAHENLSLAVANSVKAVERGALRVDTSLAGMGAGAGNCQIEAFVAVADRLGWRHGCDLFKLRDAAEELVRPLQDRPVRVDRETLTVGYAGVFACFLRHAEDAARQFQIDAREIMLEIGCRKLSVGQEDMIVEVALDFARLRNARLKGEPMGRISDRAVSVLDKSTPARMVG